MVYQTGPSIFTKRTLLFQIGWYPLLEVKGKIHIIIYIYNLIYICVFSQLVLKLHTDINMLLVFGYLLAPGLHLWWPVGEGCFPMPLENQLMSWQQNSIQFFLLSGYGGFHSHGGAPIAGWFMENPNLLKGWELGVPPILGHHHIYIYYIYTYAASMMSVTVPLCTWLIPSTSLWGRSIWFLGAVHVHGCGVNPNSWMATPCVWLLVCGYGSGPCTLWTSRYCSWHMYDHLQIEAS
jgi:hypothetical protein